MLLQLHEAGLEPDYRPEDGSVEILDAGFLIPCPELGGFEFHHYRKSAVRHFWTVDEFILHWRVFARHS